jgi:hypothetical protein
VRTHTEILPALAIAAEDLRALGDLGHEGESGTITMAIRKPKGGRLTAVQPQPGSLVDRKDRRRSARPPHFDQARTT